MISVFTPSHDPKYLTECYTSLNEQTYEDWEWVVLLNNGAEWTGPKDDRVKIQRCMTDGQGVGYYKGQAILQCRGDIFLELDHDDQLMPEALEEVKEVFDTYEDVVFCYSQFSQINADGTPNGDRFDLNHGWTYKDIDGYNVAAGFAPYPHNVSYIWYAPNHLRAFRADAYKKVNGYDPTRYILDDQDIMAKFFQIGEFYYIRENLYLQRVHGDQTQVQQETNAKIQTETVELYHKYIERNTMAWARRRKLHCLDLGAAHDKPEGYLGVDIHGGPNVNYIGDFLELDLPDNSCGLIRAYDFLEHIPDKVAVMNKIWKLLAHGGMLLSMTPDSSGRGAHQDPTHVAFWNENSFWYFTEDNYRKYVPEIEAKFQPSWVKTFYPSPWHEEKQISYVHANLVAVKNNGRDFGGLTWI